jgi:radical SAM protein with 4Fe4S-binding SPASM domain
MYFETSLLEKARKFSRLVLERYAIAPHDITIEVTTSCGRDCAVCFRGPLGVRSAEMPFTLFAKVISEIKTAHGGGGPRYLNFVGLGEPFCHPELEKMLRLAAKELPGTQLNLSTGLDPFNRESFAGLAAEGVVNRLSVSLDGIGEEGPFHRLNSEVEGNLEFLKGLRKKLPGFKIRVQTLITSRAAVEAAVNRAADIGADEVQLMRVDLHAFGGRPPAARPALAEERAIVAAASKLAAALGLTCRNNNSYNVFMDIASGLGRRCLITDDHIFITAEGDVLPCFYLREVSFGSLASRTLAEIACEREKKDFYGRQPELCRGCDIYRKEHCGEAGR